MKKLKIAIPQPCHESWAKMTSTEQGRFCNHCAKEVIDFSKLSDTELVARLKQKPQGCGRFTPSQIQRSYTIHHQERYWKKAATLLFPILLGSAPLLAQTMNNPTKTQIIVTDQKTSKQLPKVSQTRYIRGVVMDTNQETLIGAEVIIDHTNFGTFTDIDGSYELEIPAHLGDTVTVSFNYTGYESRSIQVSQSQQNLNIQLKAGDFLLGEVMVIGGFTSRPQTLVGVVRRWLRQWSWKKTERAELKQVKESDSQSLKFRLSDSFTEGLFVKEVPKPGLSNPVEQVNLQVSPNPFEHFLKIRFDLPLAQRIQLELINNAGQILAKRQQEATKGANSFDWEINQHNLPSGVYYLRLTQQNGEQEIVTLITQ